MNLQRYSNQQAMRNAEDHPDEVGVKRARREARPEAADAKADQAARSVMHPESYDPEWRYYHGAWGG